MTRIEGRYLPGSVAYFSVDGWHVVQPHDPLFPAVRHCSALYLTSTRHWADAATGRVLSESEPCPNQPSSL